MASVAIEAQTSLTSESEYVYGYNVGYDWGYYDGLAGSWGYASPEEGEDPAFASGLLAGYAEGFGEGVDASTTIAAQDFDRWCREYRLQLEVAGDVRARGTISYFSPRPADRTLTTPR